MGYRLCMMADFQNALISRIFGVFSRGVSRYLAFFRAVFSTENCK